MRAFHEQMQEHVVPPKSNLGVPCEEREREKKGGLEAKQSGGRPTGQAELRQNSEEMAESEVNICILTLDERASAVGRKKRSRKQENDARRPSVSDRGAVDDDKGDSTTGREEAMVSTSGHSLSGVSGVICR